MIRRCGNDPGLHEIGTRLLGVGRDDENLLGGATGAANEFETAGGPVLKREADFSA